MENNPTASPLNWLAAELEACRILFEGHDANEIFLSRLQLLEVNFPKNSGDFLMRAACEELLPEALALFDESESVTNSIPMALLMSRVANYLRTKSDFERAESPLAAAYNNVIGKKPSVVFVRKSSVRLVCC